MRYYFSLIIELFKLKRKVFWKSVHEITASGKKVGDIFIRGFKKPLGNFIQIYENNSFKDEFSMTSTSKSLWSSEKTYSLFLMRLIQQQEAAVNSGRRCYDLWIELTIHIGKNI